ncbi:hypothetical protein AALP_AA4G157300 [Arabis alpina]|uniref:LisH domain-containing protein n=1 Tax=Arabis alpina TaxID=50452 RepID=A0A087H3J4_ARAAL|nr:hypothetical protein AALP_AA4G157300 [Arabis alpina]
MVRSSNKSKNPERIGKGKVTPMQVAFLVDRYLFDNRFLETRSIFRSEASSLISKSPVRDVPNSLIPLDDILNEYICLKEQKVMVDQEKVRLEQEKIRVQSLLNGMQDVMNAYNSTAPAPPPPVISPAAPVATTSPSNNVGVSPSGCTANNTPNNVMPVSSLPGNKRVGSFTVPSTSQSMTKKRKSPEVSVEAPSAPKKVVQRIPQAKKATNYLTFNTPVNNRVANESSTSVAKCLFNRSTNSACPRTPQKQVSITPQQEATPTNHTFVTKERITVSPLKQIGSYTVERSHMVSSFSPVKSSKRDHVKGRLNFDDTEATMQLDASPATGDLGSSSSSSGSETDLFDIDFSNIDLLSQNFSFSELLVDFDIGCEEIQDPSLPHSSNSNYHIENASGGSSPESMHENQVPDQLVSEYTSTVTETIQGNDMNTQGSDSMTTVKSITKCLRILSPVKRQRATID